METLAEALKDGATRLILDKQGNGRGYAVILQTFKKALWPHLFPFVYESEMPVTPLSKFTTSVTFSDIRDSHSTYSENFTSFDIMAAKPYPIASYSSPDGSVVKVRDWSQRMKMTNSHHHQNIQVK